MQVFRVPPKELSLFAHANMSNEGVMVDLEYLFNSSAYVLAESSSSDQWLGGFVINQNPPFRCLGFMDHELREEMLKSKDIDTGDMVEITCIWRSLDHKSLFAQNRELFYRQMILLAVESGSPIMLGATIHAGYRRMLLPVLNYELGNHPIRVNQQQTTMWLMYGLASEAIANLNNAFAPKKV